MVAYVFGVDLKFSMRMQRHEEGRLHFVCSHSTKLEYGQHGNLSYLIQGSRGDGSVG
jgi:hypothetical protein